MSEFTAQRFLQVLRGESTGPVPRDPDDPYVRALAPGKACGRLVGGCLSDLLFTMGTPWEINLDDAIFVFEEVGSSPHGIDRALLQPLVIGEVLFIVNLGIPVGLVKDAELVQVVVLQHPAASDGAIASARVPEQGHQLVTQNDNNRLPCDHSCATSAPIPQAIASESGWNCTRIRL